MAKSKMIDRAARASLAGLLVAATGCFAAQQVPPAMVPAELGPNYERVEGLPSGMGQLRINIKWPSARTTQGIPLSARKLKFRIKKGAALETSREVDQNTTSTAFNLRSGAYELEVGAHPGIVDGTDYSGTEIAAATTSVVIYSSVVTSAPLQMQSKFEPQLGNFDDEALDPGSNFTIPGSSNLVLGWAPSLPVVTFPTQAGTGTINATVTVVTGNLTFSVPAGADLSGAFTITQDGVSRSYPYSLGAAIVPLAKNLMFNLPAVSDGVAFTAPVGQGGSTCTFSASGTWKTCGGSIFGVPICPGTGANGNGNYYIWDPADEGVNNMALIIKRASGSWMFVGTGPKSFSAASGETFTFRSNDADVFNDNNEGSLTVTYSCAWNKAGSVPLAANNSGGAAFKAPAQNNMAIRFTVAGNQKWSYLGGPANLDANGVPVDNDGNPTGDPAVVADSTFLLPGANAGALIVQRGDGSYEPVGKDRSIDVDSGENLRFFINDVSGNFATNPGSVNVGFVATAGATYGNANVEIQ